VVLATLFSLFILLASLLKPEIAGRRASDKVTWEDRIKGLKDFLPTFVIFLIVVGSIYAGFATPTESAAMGVIAGLIFAWKKGKLTFKMLKDSFEGTLSATGMIMFILVAATFLNFVLVSLGLTDTLRDFVFNLGLSPFQTLLVIIGIYIIMGFFIETLSMMVLTIPIVFPIIVDCGYDPIWFGVLLIIL
ncbi:MAG: TRAP transporter large permease subunit, partial [Chloroflexi bacterium]|nr:TRAP transporter large permease subunit [Chloroflexota bacterium]